MKNLGIWDVILGVIYLAVIIFFARRARNKNYPEGHPLRQYYLPGLYVKLVGALFIALVYQFYYGGKGDTYDYFFHAKVINSSINESFGTWFELITHGSADRDPYLYKYISQMYWYNDPSTYLVAIIAAILGLFNGTHYVPIALLFALISYSGIWAMYKTFVNLYPKLYRQLAIPFLFIPSTFVWGSAIFKDTISMFGLGWMVYTTFRIFINKDFSIKNFVMLIISFFLVGIIKVYILLAFLPALMVWLLLTYSHRIKLLPVRIFVNIFFIGLTVWGFFFFSEMFSKQLSRYSLDSLVSTSATTRGWISYASGDEGSAYDLGEITPTLQGMLVKFPAAVTVTLYRPFIWEAKKVLMFFSALESLVFAYFTILVFIRRKFVDVVKSVFSDPTIIFCLIYTLIFAFAVGISSYNFGALSRYKIPCLPFFGALLVLLLYKTSNSTMEDIQISSASRKRKRFQPAIAS